MTCECRRCIADFIGCISDNMRDVVCQTLGEVSKIVWIAVGAEQPFLNIKILRKSTLFA